MREQYNPFLGQHDNRVNSRLLTDFKPTHYDIELDPDLENASFNGQISVHLEVLNPSSVIILNSVGLEITSTEVIDSSGHATKIPKIHYDEAQQTIAVLLPNPVSAGTTIQLRHIFKGVLNDSKSMSGFMRSSYIGSDGKSKWVGSTQGQPAEMRRIFPCADEPALKATFTATIITDKSLTVLSNMDISSEKPIGSGKKRVLFNKTPRMSTYLVAFVVGELNFIESNQYRVPVRLYATPDQDIKGGHFALDVGARAMISHEKTFGLLYPLPKLDLVAIPGHSGGMENWGCVICEDRSIVADSDDVAARDKQITADLVVHELAHQWFGNIVTASWWDSIWLNESFADWATYNALTTLFPEWESWSDFVAGHPSGVLPTYQAALTLDSNRGSHPIEVPVSTPEQVSQIFDAITYAKGCSVLRMVSEYLGVEVFIKGVQLHLDKHAFGNATTDDLWISLSKVSGEDVRSLMAAWTQNVGYPILSVTEDDLSSSIVVSQRKFFQSKEASPEEDGTVYPLFLKTKSQNGIDQKSYLFERQARFSVDLKFYKLNADQTGLYRVAYPASRFEKLGLQIPLGLLSQDDRVGLLSDFKAIVSSGHDSKLRTSNFFDFAQNFRIETNEFVWRQILVCFQDIRAAWMFEDADTLKALSRFQTDLMSPTLEKLGDELWKFKESDSFRDQTFKAVLFANAGGYGPVKKASKHLFKRFAAGNSRALNPNIRKAVFDHALSDDEATSIQYDLILATFRKAKSVSTRSDALLSLPSTHSLPLIKRTLQLATGNKSSEIQSGNDKRQVLKALRAHANGAKELWEWLKRDWESLIDGPTSISNGAIVGICVGGLSTWEQYEEVKGFFKGKDTKKFDKFLEQSLDEIRGKAEWVERDREDVRDWLKNHGFYEEALGL